MNGFYYLREVDADGARTTALHWSFWALVLLIGGWMLIKIALNIVKKALAKTNLDEAMHKFIINTVKNCPIWVLLAITHARMS